MGDRSRGKLQPLLNESFEQELVHAPHVPCRRRGKPVCLGQIVTVGAAQVAPGSSRLRKHERVGELVRAIRGGRAGVKVTGGF